MFIFTLFYDNNDILCFLSTFSFYLWKRICKCEPYIIFITDNIYLIHGNMVTLSVVLGCNRWTAMHKNTNWVNIVKIWHFFHAIKKILKVFQWTVYEGCDWRKYLKWPTDSAVPLAFTEMCSDTFEVFARSPCSHNSTSAIWASFFSFSHFSHRTVTFRGNVTLRVHQVQMSECYKSTEPIFLFFFILNNCNQSWEFLKVP